MEEYRGALWNSPEVREINSKLKFLSKAIFSKEVVRKLTLQKISFDFDIQKTNQYILIKSDPLLLYQNR